MRSQRKKDIRELVERKSTPIKPGNKKDKEKSLSMIAFDNLPPTSLSTREGSIGKSAERGEDPRNTEEKNR